MTDEDRWVTLGWLMAAAEMARNHDVADAVRNILTDHGITPPAIRASGLQPYDIRELAKLLAAPSGVVIPFPEVCP